MLIHRLCECIISAIFIHNPTVLNLLSNDMEDCFLHLTETDDEADSVGDVFYHAKSKFYIAPFVHCGVHYLTYFVPVAGGIGENVTLGDFKGAVESCCDHKVGDNPFVLKFGLKNNFESNDVFGADQQQKIGRVLFTLPKKLAICVDKLMAKTGSNEFYFLAGSQDEEHQDKLDKWYRRVSDRLAAEHGLAPIHSDTEGGWYGYKKND